MCDSLKLSQPETEIVITHYGNEKYGDNSNNDSNNSNSNSNSNSKNSNNTMNKIAKSKEFRKMIRYLCDALSNLQKTYKSGNVILAIQYYINMLNDGLDGKFYERYLPVYLVELNKKYETLLDYNKIKSLWNVKDIERICQLYDHCYDVQYDKGMTSEMKKTYINGYLTSVNIILQKIDKDFRKLVINSNKG